YWVKKAILGSSPMARFLIRQVRKVERALCRSSDVIFACSEEDKACFADLYDIPKDKIFIIPNGVDTQEIYPATALEREAAKGHLGMSGKTTILFVGSGYKPNAEAVDFIVKRLAPQLPDSHFLIMGGVGDFYRHSLCGPEDTIPGNITFFGVVDVQQRNIIYQASDLAINPMFAGSGTNIKMFDYMAAGIPAITTAIGARGINGSNDTFLICEEQDFVKNIRMIL